MPSQHPSPSPAAGTTPPVVNAFRAAYAAGKEMPRAGVAIPASWTENAREYFLERAAFLEYAGGHSRTEAEQLAVTAVCLALGVEGVQQPAPATAEPVDDGLTDLFGDVAPRQSINAVTAGH